MLIQSRNKRLTAMITVVLMVLMLLPATAFAAKAPTIVRVLDTAIVTTELTAVNKVADLNAGQNTDVGDLFIDARGGNEYLVTYMLDAPDYYFGQIHFEAINDGNLGFTDDSKIIYSDGGVVPGKLTVNETFNMPVIDELSGIVSGGTREYSFIYTSGAPVDAFAAHSVVCMANTVTTQVEVQNGTDPVSGTIISDAGMPMVSGGTTVEVREPFGYPDETTVEYNSVWDDAFDNTPAFNNKIIANGAQIVWNGLYSSGETPTTNDQTIYGDVLKVNVPITVPADASNMTGTLYIVTDNAYIAKIGDSLIGSAGFNAANYATKTSATEVALTNDALLLEVFPTLSARDPITGDALFTANVVDSAAWNTMITAATSVPLALGLNTIEIAAMNEYFGSLDGQGDGTWYNNPAGVIFFIEYAWDVPHMEWQDRYSLEFDCETAWGMGDDADGSNWSQIITEVPIFTPDPVLIQTLNVPSNNSIGVSSTNLTAGKEYLIEVSGTWKFVNWATVAIPDLGYADAGYSYRIPLTYATNTVNAWVEGDDLNPPWGGYLELQIDNQNIEWGEYNSEHLYTFEVTGSGSSLNFRILDNVYGDNVGSLTVNIYEQP